MTFAPQPVRLSISIARGGLYIAHQIQLAIYDAYVYSKIRYGIEIYGSLNVTLRKRLQIVSNKLLKILFCMSPFHSTNQQHKGLDILQINDVYKASVLKFVFLCVNHTPLSIFDQYYKRRRDQYSRSLRDLLNLHVPDGYSAIALSSTKIHDAKLWNELPLEIRKLDDVYCFKEAIKKHFMKSYS